MDIQEKAALVAARLKASTYKGDRIEAMKEAMKIAEEDSVIAGTYFLDALYALVEQMEMVDDEILYKVLNKIMTSKNGSEFIDILYKKAGVAGVMVKYITDKRTEDKKEIENMVRTVVKEKQSEMSHEIMATEEQNVIFEQIEQGKEIVMDVVEIIARSSGVVRKFLIYNGIIERIMNTAIKTKETYMARKALNTLAMMVGEGKEVAEYMTEIGWREWIVKIMEKHPHHSTSVVCAMLSQSTRRDSVSAIYSKIVEKKELVCTYMVLRQMIQRKAMNKESGAHDSTNMRIVKGISVPPGVSQCMTKINCVIGIESSMQAVQNTKKGQMGDVQYMAYIMHSKKEIDEMDIAEYLYQLSNFSKMSYTEAVVYMKTALVIMERHNSEMMYNTEIMRIVKEIVETEGVEKPIKSLAAYWMIRGCVDGRGGEHKRESRSKDGSGSTVMNAYNTELLRSVEDACVYHVQYLLAALVMPHRIEKEYTRCGSRKCRRCYYTDITAQGVYMPSVCVALANALWMPECMHSYILGTYAEYMRMKTEVDVEVKTQAEAVGEEEHKEVKAESSEMKESKKESHEVDSSNRSSKEEESVAQHNVSQSTDSQSSVPVHKPYTKSDSIFEL